MPGLYIIAGCNGAGKTTASFTILPEMLNCKEFVNAEGIAIFRSIVERKHSYETFQSPDKIREALSLIWNEQHKWQKIAQSIGRPENVVKTELNNIVIRRNQIVHEMDIDLSTGTTQPISHATTKQIVDFIKLLGDVIYSLM